MNTKNQLNDQCITLSQMNMIFNVRIFYKRLMNWIRGYIFTRYYKSLEGSDEDVFGRFYLDSVALSNILQLFFGRESSEKLSRLIGQYIFIFRDLLTSQLEGNTAAINQNVERLYHNAAERAAFLHAINPYWSEAEFRSDLETFVQLTIEAANALATGDIEKDLEVYSRLTELTDKMGETFVEGLNAYIVSGSLNTGIVPYQDGSQCFTLDQMNNLNKARIYWFERVVGIITYILSRYNLIAGPDEIYRSLEQATSEYLTIYQQIFGEQAAEDFSRLQKTNLDLITALTAAQMEGNTDEINRVTRLLYQNADETAAFFASMNPFWDENQLRSRFYRDLQNTINFSTSILVEDYARAVDIIARLLDQAECTGNYIIQGLLSYINQQNIILP